MACCIFVARAVWESIGGYDEWHRWGYEDWSFFLNLGKNGYFGHYIEQPLFGYRTHGRGLHYIGLERHRVQLGAHDRTASGGAAARGPPARQARVGAVDLLRRAGRARASFENQTVRDYQTLVNVDERRALERSRAPAFLWLSGDRPLQPQAAEECIWGLTEADWVTWKDTGDAPPPSLSNFAGPLGVSRRVMQQPEPKPSGAVRRLPWSCREAAPRAGRESGRVIAATAAGALRGALLEPVSAARHADDGAPAARQAGFAGAAAPAATSLLTGETQPAPLAADAPAALGQHADRLYHHLQNAEILSREAWLKHPLRSSARLIPLRWKERVNQAAGRPVFDLSFYLKFQPRSVLLGGTLIERLDYIPPQPQTRRRIGLFTPHLGVGGAENVLLEFARQIDRSQYEILLIATQSRRLAAAARMARARRLGL